ncbi:TPA: hypothetical protein N1953_002147 [Pseudomonas aeruginosa AC9A]|nr:hypothetical protein [Pseudomonas aeruginosa AC9A]
MTATSDLIESLISYSWDDWQVTRQEARRVIAAIRNDNVPDATIAALDKSGSLIKLFQRVGRRNWRARWSPASPGAPPCSATRHAMP